MRGANEGLLLGSPSSLWTFWKPLSHFQLGCGFPYQLDLGFPQFTPFSLQAFTCRLHFYSHPLYRWATPEYSYWKVPTKTWYRGYSTLFSGLCKDKLGSYQASLNYYWILWSSKRMTARAILYTFCVIRDLLFKFFQPALKGNRSTIKT